MLLKGRKDRNMKFSYRKRIQCTLDYPVCGLFVNDGQLHMTSEQCEKWRDIDLEKWSVEQTGCCLLKIYIRYAQV